PAAAGRAGRRRALPPQRGETNDNGAAPFEAAPVGKKADARGSVAEEGAEVPGSALEGAHSAVGLAALSVDGAGAVDPGSGRWRQDGTRAARVGVFAIHPLVGRVDADLGLRVLELDVRVL